MVEKTADFYYNKATEYFEDKIFNLAIDNFNKALELQPDYPHAHYNLGITMFEKKDFEQAITCFKKALEIDPEDAHSYSNLALLYLKKRDHEIALEYYKKSVELDPENFGLYKDIGDVYLKSKDYDSAIEWYKKAIEANGCFIAAKQALKWAEDQKNTQLIKEAQLNQPPEKTAPSAQDFFNTGATCVKNQNLDEALVNFRKCLKLNPEHVKAKMFINKIIELKQKGV